MLFRWGPQILNFSPGTPRTLSGWQSIHLIETVAFPVRSLLVEVHLPHVLVGSGGNEVADVPAFADGPADKGG